MKTRWIFQFTVMLFVSVVSVSCKDEIVVPETPGQVIINPPGNQDPEVPVVNGNKVKRITWSALDFKTFQYNTRGLLVKLYSQYNDVQGTDHVKQFVYDFVYNTAGQVSETKDNLGTRYVYTYENGVWKEAMAYDGQNRLVRKYVFEFNTQKQLIKSQSFLPGENAKPISKASFQYDAVGNLVNFKREWYDENTQGYTSQIEIVFSAFDDKKYALQAETFGDELLPVSFWVNNPGKKEFINSSSPVEHYTYTYNEDGYPVSKHTRYTYYKPIPELRAVYTY